MSISNIEELKIIDSNMPPEKRMIVSKTVTLYPEILRTEIEFTVYFSKTIAKGSDFNILLGCLGPCSGFFVLSFREGTIPYLCGGIFSYYLSCWRCLTDGKNERMSRMSLKKGLFQIGNASWTNHNWFSGGPAFVFRGCTYTKKPSLRASRFVAKNGSCRSWGPCWRLMQVGVELHHLPLELLGMSSFVFY